MKSQVSNKENPGQGAINFFVIFQGIISFNFDIQVDEDFMAKICGDMA